MKKFSCGDVVPSCAARFQASSNVELLAKVAAHARDAHGLDPVPPGLVAEVERHIVTE